MKVLSFSALTASLIGLIFGLYCQFELIPLAASSQFMDMEMYYLYSDRVIGAGTKALLLGGAGVLLSIYPVIKKNKIAYIAIILGLISVFLGLVQATHIFS